MALRRIGSADERAGRGLHCDSRKRELVHSDMSQRVHAVGQQGMLGGRSHRHRHMQPVAVHGLGADERRPRHVHCKHYKRELVHTIMQHRLCRLWLVLVRNRHALGNCLLHRHTSSHTSAPAADRDTHARPDRRRERLRRWLVGSLGRVLQEL